MSLAARRFAWITTLVGVGASAVSTTLRLGGVVHSPWWVVLAPACGVAACWLLALIVAAAVVRGMVRHGPDMP